ncbi:MAG TPA: NAD(P)-dependent oxidoreductase [Solirubrobacteraceae bacterium]|nr:NAD(P)-dependent oxidoreductase [Solirubrobacteraceae bacterium]
MSTVLVTGATGFVGRHAVAALRSRGHEVVAVRSRSGAPVDGAARTLVADLLDGDGHDALVADAGASHLLHLAWYAEHGRFWTALENLDWIGATLRLLRAFREGGGRRAVVAGTCAEYAWDGEGPLEEEGTPLRPSTLYGAAKRATHVAAEAYARQEGLGLAWGRIFFLFGPGEAPGRLIPSVAGALLRGEEAAVTAGEQVRDFLAIEELGGAFAAMLESDVEGAVNVASGRAVPVREVVGMVGRALGAEDRIRYGALPARPGDPPSIVADVRRLRDEVGWAPRESLEAGIERVVAALRDASPQRDAQGGVAGSR